MRQIITIRRRRPLKSGGPTLHDVARVAAVSTATASRALSRPELVSEAVHDRVLAAIATLGYVPNAAAQALSGRPSRLVGAVLSTLEDPLTVLGLEALTRELALRRVALILAFAGDGAEGTAGSICELAGRGVDAIVLCGDVPPVEPLDLRPPRRLSCASLDGAGCNASWVRSGFEHAKAVALAVRYLRQLGHRQIAFCSIGGDHRVNAVRAAIADVDIDMVLGGDAKAVGGAGDAFDHWQALPSPPTAVICGSDAAAIAILHECARRAIEVPGQLSVVGFGDTELSRQAHPALSTLRTPAREAGRALARGLLAALAGLPETPPELSAKLVARESTGVPQT